MQKFYKVFRALTCVLLSSIVLQTTMFLTAASVYFVYDGYYLALLVPLVLLSLPVYSRIKFKKEKLLDNGSRKQREKVFFYDIFCTAMICSLVFLNYTGRPTANELTENFEVLYDWCIEDVYDEEPPKLLRVSFKALRGCSTSTINVLRTGYLTVMFSNELTAILRSCEIQNNEEFQSLIDTKLRELDEITALQEKAVTNFKRDNFVRVLLCLIYSVAKFIKDDTILEIKSKSKKLEVK